MEGSEMKVFNDIVKSDLKPNDRKLNLLRDTLKIEGLHKIRGKHNG